MCIIHILLPAVMLLYYCWFSETTTRGMVYRKCLPLMAVCDLFVRGVEHGDAFYKERVFSDMVGHYLGEKKKKNVENVKLANLRS